MLTENRGYPLLGGSGSDIILDDIAAINNAFIAIDTDVDAALAQAALGATAVQPGKLLATINVASPVSIVSFYTATYNMQIGKTYRLMVENATLDAAINANCGFVVGNSNHWYASRQSRSVAPYASIQQNGNGSFYLWNINAGLTAIKHIKDLYCDFELLTGGTYGVWKGRGRTSETSAWLEHDGCGSVGFGQGGGASFNAAAVSFYAVGGGGANRINSGTFKLYEIDAWSRAL